MKLRIKEARWRMWCSWGQTTHKLRYLESGHWDHQNRLVFQCGVLVVTRCSHIPGPSREPSLSSYDMPSIPHTRCTSMDVDQAVTFSQVPFGDTRHLPVINKASYMRSSQRILYIFHLKSMCSTPVVSRKVWPSIWSRGDPSSILHSTAITTINIFLIGYEIAKRTLFRAIFFGFF